MPRVPLREIDALRPPDARMGQAVQSAISACPARRRARVSRSPGPGRNRVGDNAERHLGSEESVAARDRAQPDSQETECTW